MNVRKHSEETIFDTVAKQTVRMLGSPVDQSSITVDTDLTAVGLDSLSIVNLVDAVEKELGVEGLDLQGWLDEQMELGDARFTVGSLVRQFLALP